MKSKQPLFAVFLFIFCCLPTSSFGQHERFYPQYFGYAAIACDLDDPFDDSSKTDYSDEVASFTNANQVCVTANLNKLADRLRHAARLFTPVFYVEPVFFNISQGRTKLNANRNTLWETVKLAIRMSGVSPNDLIFYIADEPTLRGLSLSDIEVAIAQIREDYPSAKTLVIEAYHGPDAPKISKSIDYWGFNAYTIINPSAHELYTSYLDQAIDHLAPHQSIVLVMDATHTPIHLREGISIERMADVARNYFELSQTRGEISMILGYAWAGGIDNEDELGIRDMPASVIKAHKEIGEAIMQKRRPSKDASRAD